MHEGATTLGKNVSGSGITSDATPEPEVEPMAQGNAMRVLPTEGDATAPPLRIAPPKRETTELDAHYAPCRTAGHEWRHQGIDPHAYDGALVGLRSVCGHCRMGRTLYFTRTGYRAKVAPRYTPPPEYRKHGDAVLQRHEWAQLMLATALPVRPRRRR